MNRLAKILTTESRNLVLAQKAICLLLLIFAAHSAAQLTWQGLDIMVPVAKGPALPTAPSSAPSGAAPVATSPPVLHLFGTPAKTDNVDINTPRSAPKTTLKLILKGIVAADPMSRALAIVAEKKGNSEDKVYGIGDMLPGNARVLEIYADRIILQRAGRRETLFLHADAESANSGGGRVGTISSVGDGTHWKIDNGYWQKRLADIPSLAREIGVDIYKEGNVQKGYRLVSARGSKLLRDLGLAPGDVLHEVNGVKLTNVHQGLAAYQKIRNASEIRVVVSRNGKRQTRVYNIDK